MEAHPREVRAFEASSGKLPFYDWLRRLRDVKGRAAIRLRVDRLEDGNFGDSKSVGEGVFELRIYVGPGYRVYFAEDGPRIILLLLGGDKKTQAADIREAKGYWQEHKGRSK